VTAALGAGALAKLDIELGDRLSIDAGEHARRRNRHVGSRRARGAGRVRVWLLATRRDQDE
jgi:hypothetical protein